MPAQKIGLKVDNAGVISKHIFFGNSKANAILIQKVKDKNVGAVFTEIDSASNPSGYDSEFGSGATPSIDPQQTAWEAEYLVASEGLRIVARRTGLKDPAP